jgi:hypothetical protein
MSKLPYYQTKCNNLYKVVKCQKENRGASECMCSLHVNDANFDYNAITTSYFPIELLDVQLSMVLGVINILLFIAPLVVFLEKGSVFLPSTLLPDACHLVQLVELSIYHVV